MLKRLLPFAALLTLACGGGEVSDPAPAPASEPATAEADIDPAGMVADRPGSHCEGDTLYHCEIEGGKHAEVCNEDGWMVYRFGALGDVEAEFPGPEMPTDWKLLTVPGGKTLKFTMHDNEVMLSHLPGVTSGVMISAPDDSILEAHDCVGEVTTDWATMAKIMPD